MIQLIIASRLLAVYVLQNPKRQVDFCISIGDPQQVLPSGFTSVLENNRLRLEFFDRVTGCDLYLPTIQHVEQLVEFTQTQIKPVLDTNPTVLVHCEAGISRSPAVAHILLEVLGYSPIDALATVMAERPQALPNTYLLDLYRAIV